MSACERLSDRMPDVSLGRASWTAEEETHLRGCADCAAEWALLRATAALGTGRGESVVAGAEEITARVRLRVADEGPASAPWRRAWWVAGAAAAAIWIGAMLTDGRPTGESAPMQVGAAAGGVLVPLPELEGLEAAELDSLLRTMDTTQARAAALDPSTLDASTLGEHEDGELERLLGTWEG